MSATGEQRKLAAIMFTDMVGYSALSHRDGKLALDLRRWGLHDAGVLLGRGGDCAERSHNDRSYRNSDKCLHRVGITFSK